MLNKNFLLSGILCLSILFLNSCSKNDAPVEDGDWIDQLDNTIDAGKKHSYEPGLTRGLIRAVWRQQLRYTHTILTFTTP